MLIKYLKLLVIITPLFFLPLACEDMEVLFVDCDDCYSDNPKYASISINFTLNKENQQVYYTLYKGSIENGEIIASEVAITAIKIWYLPTNNQYSILAEYIQGGRCVNVVNGTDLRTRLDRGTCENECYIILGDKLDARLKY